METQQIVIVVKTPDRFVVCQQSKRNPRLYLMVTDLCYEFWHDAERGAIAHEQKVIAETEPPKP